MTILCVPWYPVMRPLKPIERERARLSLHLAGQIEDAPAIRTLDDGGHIAGFIQRERDWCARRLGC